jgi:hypothetical protein
MSRPFLPVFLILIAIACSALGAQKAVVYEHFTAVW